MSWTRGCLGWALLLSSAGVSAATVAWQQQGEALLARYQIAGAAVVVIANGSIDQSLVYGNATLEPQDPVTASTVFQAGSVSKPVASWAVLRLVQEGRLDLDTPVAEYLSRWTLPASDFDAGAVTVRRLLSHTAGLRLGGYLGFDPDTPLPDLSQSLDGATNGSGPVQLVFAPGTQFSYSGGGYTLLQLLVEEVSGLSFAQYIAQSVLQPLGMVGSSYAPSAAQLGVAATPHDRAGSRLPAYRFTALAAAGLYATADDLGRFVIANMSSNPVLTDVTRRLQQTPVEIDGAPGPTGLGWFVREPGLIGHSGSNLGWKADVWFRPAQQDGIVVLTNSESGGEFSDDMICLWAAAQGVVALDERCALRADQSSGLDTIRIAVMVLAALAAVVLLVRLALGGRPCWPQRMVARVALVFLLLVAVAVAGFMWTAGGAYLVSGRALPMTTVNFLPYRMAEAMPYLVAIVLLAAAHVGLRRA